jgi:hypothetical protein
MNKYGLPLTTPSRQTILPALTQDGHVRGWYPITARTFTGSETSFTLSDSGNGGAGTVVPLMTVTQDSGRGLPQYMAAVWPSGLAANYQPWGSTLLQKPDVGYYHWYSMATESWFEHFGGGALIDGLLGGTLNLAVSAASNPSAPTVTTPLALTWQASIEYAMLNGDCPFFDFNWITLFNAKSATAAQRIVVTSNPAPVAPDPLPYLVASVIGVPTINTAGATIYDTIRIMKLGDEVPAGSYAFGFTVYDELGQTTTVTLNLTVV